MQKEIIDFRQEFYDHGEYVINGSELLDKYESLSEWIKYTEKNSNKLTVSSGWVLTDTFLALNDENKIVGIICLHYELNDFLKCFGQVGYSVRPTERRKGYATLMLKKLLELAKTRGLDEIIISAEDGNIASIKTILKNNGQYLKSAMYRDCLINIYIIIL